MRSSPVLVLALVGAAAVSACESEPPPSAPAPDPGEELSGGETTVFDETREAYARPARNLDPVGRETFSLGDHQFARTWITAPASAEGSDGLGPLYNATNCSGCHFKDGRGAPPAEGTDFVGLLLRLSVPGPNGPEPEPTYGGQLNPFGIPGVPGEAQPRVTYEEVPGAYADGETFSLRRPTYTFEALAYGPMADGTMVSPRIAPAMIGLGLLEALDESTLLELADPEDADGDGISGKANYVDDVLAKTKRIGRFGWKSNQPSVLQQSAGAFVGDLGVTSPLFPDDECTAAQTGCLSAPDGGAPELDDSKLSNIAFYGRTLAVPARRKVADPSVLRGRDLFRASGCGSCHAFGQTTGTLDGHPELSNQRIFPYTDLLLHDMGPGLADGRPDFEADGNEWRTAPLWGIGLLHNVNKHDFLLHDGRARGFAEAILWHGGEAEASKEAFRTMPKADRDAVLTFLESL